MVVDSAGRVWVGNDGGVSVFINGDEENWPAWVTYTVADGLPSPRINDLVIDDKNHIWAATDKGWWFSMA